MKMPPVSRRLVFNSVLIVLLAMGLGALILYVVVPVGQVKNEQSTQATTLSGLLQISPCIKRQDDGTILPTNDNPLCRASRDNFAVHVTPPQSCSIVGHAQLEVVIPGLGTFPVRCGLGVMPVKVKSSGDAVTSAQDVQPSPATDKSEPPGDHGGGGGNGGSDGKPDRHPTPSTGTTGASGATPSEPGQSSQQVPAPGTDNGPLDLGELLCIASFTITNPVMPVTVPSLFC